METSQFYPAAATQAEKRAQILFPNLTPFYRNPLLLVKARGCRVWDEQGREFLDGFGGVVTISLGHNHPAITTKIREMLGSEMIQHTSQFYLHPYLEALAEKLLAVSPGPLRRVYFTNSGSEANEMAILAARQATGVQTMLALRFSYHGGTAATLGLCGDSRWKFPHTPPQGTIHVAAPYCYRCPYGARPETCQLECADEVQRAVEQGSSGTIAGIIVETILGVGGVIDPPAGYHQRVYNHIKRHGGNYIADEVQSGIGRTGEHFFAIASRGVTPDLITVAKGLGNGAPIAAVLSNETSALALNGKLQVNTFAGGPYQSMQAGVVVEETSKPAFLAQVAERGKQLKEGLDVLFDEFSLCGEIRGRGLLLGIELVADRRSKQPAPEACLQLLEACKDEGLLLGRGGYYGNVVRIAPPLTITVAEVDELLVKLRRALLAIPR